MQLIRLKCNGGSDDGSNNASDNSDDYLTVCLGLLSVALVSVLSKATSHFGLTALPEASLAVIVGLVGCILMYLGGVDPGNNATMKFSNKFFFVWLLPPIVFDAGFCLSQKPFFENLGASITLAFVGTFVNASVVSAIVYAAGQLNWCHQLGPLPSIAFGTLISATDPVTVLAVFQKLNVDKGLFAIVLGEAVLNDAVVIVLYKALADFRCDEDNDYVTSAIVGRALCNFFVTFVLSCLLGVGSGCLSALTLKGMSPARSPAPTPLASQLRASRHQFTGSDAANADNSSSPISSDVYHTDADVEDANNTSHESLAMLVYPWTAYFLAETCGLSGIVTILFCGLSMSRYALRNLTKDAQQMSKSVSNLLAKAAETFVFIYLGWAIFAFKHVFVEHDTMSYLVSISIAACLFARAVSVVFCAAMVNIFRARTGARPITRTHILMIWFAGLRGGIALAIAATGYADKEFSNEQSLAMFQATMYIALFTIFVFGGLVSSLAAYFHVIPEHNERGRSGSGLGLPSWLDNDDPRAEAMAGNGNVTALTPVQADLGEFEVISSSTQAAEYEGMMLRYVRKLDDVLHLYLSSTRRRNQVHGNSHEEDGY